MSPSNVSREYVSDLFLSVTADTFVKRIKSTQQDLAQKDLEMLEQFYAKQRAECFHAAGEHSEQATREHERKVVEASVDQSGTLLVFEHKDTRKGVGRSAMDQVEFKHMSRYVDLLD